MSGILEALEERLLQFLLEHETKKTWEEWLQWLDDLDCPLKFEKPHQIPNRPFSFQTWLTACDRQLSQHPDWQARLSTPAWLKRQQITIVPRMLKSGENPSPAIAEIGGLSISRIKRRLKNLGRGIESDFVLIKSYSNSINKYLVELHKKFSIPFASIVFILIGAPLGMMVRKGGFAVSMAFSLGFFIIYWIFLISGEEFADRGYLSPALSMWLPNLVLGPLGLFMCYRHSQELGFLKFNLFRTFKWNKGQTR